MQQLEAHSASGWDRRRARVARDIEGAALELFVRSGPADVTVEQIAAAAGISNRTFFRYFASRDDILAAVPQRALERISAQVRARPPSEGIVEAFAAGGEDVAEDPDERRLVLLWATVVRRSPAASARALTTSAIAVTDAFESLIAERLEIPRDDPRVGVLAAAIGGVVAHTFWRWVADEGTAPPGAMIADSLRMLGELGGRPRA